MAIVTCFMYCAMIINFVSFATVYACPGKNIFIIYRIIISIKIGSLGYPMIRIAVLIIALTAPFTKRPAKPAVR